MPNHYRLFSDTKQQYQRLFQEAQRSLAEAVLALIPNDAAENAICSIYLPIMKERSNIGEKPFMSVESGFSSETLTPERQLRKLLAHEHHSGCSLTAWRQRVVVFLETEVARDVLHHLNQIQAYKQTFECHQCGQCCRLASSDASYDQLQSRAARGDEFARQFTSVFLPYPSPELAKQRFPESVAAIYAHVGSQPDATQAQVHLYFCPYIGEDNNCTIYNDPKRPEICAKYPESPLGYVPVACGWKPWQEDTHLDTLLAHATLNLCEDWLKRLKPSPIKLLSMLTP